MTEIELRCKKCTRYLGIKFAVTMIAQVRCPNSKCKHVNNIKLVSSNCTTDQIRYKFATK